MARAAAYRTQNPKEASLLLQWSSLIHIVCDLPYLFDHGICVSFAQIALRFSDSQQYVNKGVSQHLMILTGRYLLQGTTPTLKYIEGLIRDSFVSFLTPQRSD